MTKAFKKFLRLAVPGRLIDDRCKLVRAFIRAKAAHDHPEFTEDQVLTFVEEHFRAYQDDPPNAEAARKALLTFQAEQRALRAKQRAQRAANARWSKKHLADSGNGQTDPK